VELFLLRHAPNLLSFGYSGHAVRVYCSTKDLQGNEPRQTAFGHQVWPIAACSCLWLRRWSLTGQFELDAFDFKTTQSDYSIVTAYCA
jgi:hypothetical protein